MNSNPDYRFLNGKRLYKKLTILRDESTIHDELFCTLEASKSSVIADLGVTDGIGRVMVFDNWLVDKFMRRRHIRSGERQRLPITFAFTWRICVNIHRPKNMRTLTRA